MPHIRFNWVDVLFVTLLIRVGYVGYKNGLLPEFLRFLGLLSAFIVSFNNYTLISHFISTHTKWTGAKPDVISFLFIFLSILLIFRLLAGATSLFSGGENISGLNRFLGLMLGFGRGILLISLIYTLFINSPFKYLSRSARSRSFSSQYISDVAPVTYRIGINFYPWEKIDTPLAKSLEKNPI